MNKEQLLSSIDSGPFSEETKKKVHALLSEQELTIEIAAQIRDLLQAEIDKDFEALGVELDPNDEDAKNALKEFEDGVDAVEKELSEDMEFVQDKMAEIDSLRSQLDAVLDQEEIEKLKADLPQ